MLKKSTKKHIKGDDNNVVGKDDSINLLVLDFISSQHFFAFERNDKGMRKKLITKVRVRVEVEK